jgi:hypothetical protein
MPKLTHAALTLTYYMAIRMAARRRMLYDVCITVAPHDCFAIHIYQQKKKP